MPKGGNGGGSGGNGGGGGGKGGGKNKSSIEFDLVSLPADHDEGSSGITTYTYTLTRTGDLSSEAWVDYTITGVDIDEDDFVSLLGTVYFGSGEAEATLTVEVVADDAVENDETFTVELISATGADLGTESSISNVIVNDDTSIEFNLILLPTDQPEGSGANSTYTYTVRRTGDLSVASSADWQVIGITADDADFLATQGTVNFGIGEDEQTITVEVIGDLDVEADETFSVVLTNPTNASIGLNSLVTNTILDDDTATPVPVVEFDLTLHPADQDEGSGANSIYTYTVKRTGDLTIASSVDYQVAGVTADGTDFVNQQGTVNFGVGVDAVTFDVEVVGDTAAEGNEVFSVFLTNAVDADIGGAYIVSNTILDDDGAIEFDLAAQPVDQAEGTGGNSIYTYTLTRTGDLSAAASVDYEVVSIEADASDFVSTSGTVNFGIGIAEMTFDVEVVGDATAENDEIFSVNLLNPVGAQLGLADSVFNTILNDDGAPPDPTTIIGLDLTALPVSQNEGTGANSVYTYTVLRSGDLTGEASVNWFITGISVDNADFIDVEGIVTFADGVDEMTFNVEVVGDSILEADEVFNVNLTNAVNADLDGLASLASNTIINDDAPPPDPGTVYLSGDDGVADDQEFNIELNFVGDIDDTVKANFIYAADLLSSIIQGDIDDIDLGGGDVIDDVRIEVEVLAIDGFGGLAGEGTVTAARAGADPDAYLPYSGHIQIDAEDVDLLSLAGVLDDIVFHEMMHAIGFGTSVWDDLGLLNQTGPNFDFTGANALLQYQADGGTGDLSLDTYGAGSDMTFYWQESEFDNEIMTLAVDSLNYLSNMTVAALEDMGYDTVWDGVGSEVYVWL